MKITNIFKVYGTEGKHCAFTDIISYNGRYYLGFMEGPQHMVDPDNHGIIMSSEDGKTWEIVHQIHCGKDTREPKFVVRDGELLCYFFTIEPSIHGKRMITDSWRMSSMDGSVWSKAECFATEEKYWRPVYYNNFLYCVTHPKDPAPDRPCRLMCSSDGLNWDHLADVPIDYSQKPNEASLAFDKEGVLKVFIRTDLDKREAYVLTSRAPYNEFTKKSLDLRMGGPLLWFDGDEIYLGARFFPSPDYSHTGIFRLNEKGLPQLITVLPSMGDSSYMGITRKLDDSGWLISYYSSHESLNGNLFSSNHGSIYLVEADDQ